MKADIFQFPNDLRNEVWIISKAILSLPSFIYLLIPYLLALKKKTLNSIRSYCFFLYIFVSSYVYDKRERNVMKLEWKKGRARRIFNFKPQNKYAEISRRYGSGLCSVFLA